MADGIEIPENPDERIISKVMALESQMETICRKLKPIAGRSIDCLWARHQTEKDPLKRGRYERIAQAMFFQAFGAQVDNNQILLPPPTRQAASGEFSLGEVLYNNRMLYDWGLNSDELTRHIILAGMTGSGKTNTAYLLAQEFMRHGKKIMIFDWKNDYRGLLNDSELKNDIYVFSIGQQNMPIVSFNLLVPPPGIDPKSYINLLVPILGDALFLGEGVFAILRRGIDALYQRFGVYGRTELKKWPVMRDLLDWLQTELKTQSFRDREWKTSTQRAIEALCFGPFSRVINVPDSTFNVADLLNKNVIIELGELGEAEKKVFVQGLLLWIRYYLKFNGQRNVLTNAIFFEEAHHILLKHKAESGMESETDIALRELREFGICCIIIDQCPYLLSPPALANSFTSICMYLKSGQDINAMATSMYLDQEQKQFIGRLQTGQAIVKMAGRWLDPFLVQFSMSEIKNQRVSDDEIRIHMQSKGYSGFSGAKAEEYRELNELCGCLEKDKIVKTEMVEAVGTATGLDKLAEEYLLDINRYPFDKITARSKRLVISNSKGQALRERLIKEGYINQQEVKLRTGHTILLELTKKGMRLLHDLGLELSFAHKLEGSVEHLFFYCLIGEMNKSKGYEVRYEEPIGGDKRADQLLIKDGKVKMAIEIETGKSQFLYNIEKDLELHVPIVVSVATNDEAYFKIIEALRNRGLDNDDRIIVVKATQYT